MWAPGSLITAVPKLPFLNIAEDILHQMTAFVDHGVVMQHEPGQWVITHGHTAEHVVRSAVVAVTKSPMTLAAVFSQNSKSWIFGTSISNCTQ